MRKVIVANIISLDGCFTGPDGNVMAMPFGPGFSEYNAERLLDAGTLLLGRTTYEGFRDTGRPSPTTAGLRNSSARSRDSTARSTRSWSPTRSRQTGPEHGQRLPASSAAPTRTARWRRFGTRTVGTSWSSAATYYGTIFSPTVWSMNCT